MRIARYGTVPSKSTIDGRLREKSIVSDRLREKKKKRKRRKKKKKRRRRKKYLLSLRRPR
ncbi:hypothetical protein B296_00037037, partial [Ensete ventricosum]